MTKRLLVMAGGTGGHIFPGIAVARELQQQGWQIHWLGTAARMEAQLVPKAGFDISYIDVAGVRGNGIIRLLKAPFAILKSIWQAKAVIRDFQPDAVLGMGGFASGPGGVAAWLMRVPLVVHEQNAIAGMTNKILSRFAKYVLSGFENSQIASSHVEWVGNPVRDEFAQVPTKTQIDTRVSTNILVVGGSLGAKCLNEHVPKAIAALAKQHGGKLHIRHQSGQQHHASVTSVYEAIVNKQANWQVHEFIDDMVAAYDWADVIICRAGALTVAEVAAAGRCAIFVPLPHAVDDHQTWNARALVDQQAALLLSQTELEQGNLLPTLTALLADHEKVEMMSSNAKTLAKLDATNAVANVCTKAAGMTS